MLSRPPISLMGYHRPFAFLMSFAKLLPLAPKNCWEPCCRNHCKGQTNSKLPPFRALQGYVGAIRRLTSWSNFDPPPSKKVLWDLFSSLLCFVSKNYFLPPTGMSLAILLWVQQICKKMQLLLAAVVRFYFVIIIIRGYLLLLTTLTTN